MFDRLIGKAVGDSITLRENPFGIVSARISEIKSKYVFALNESLMRFETLFPGRREMMSFPVPHDETKKDATGSLKPIVDMVNRRHGFATQVEQLYQAGQLTLGAIANLLKCDIFSVWGTLVRSNKIGIRMCLGTETERVSALALLKDETRPLCADIVALITIQYLELEDVLRESGRQIVVAQSTIDLIDNALREREGLPAQGFLTLGKEGDQLVKEEISPEQIEATVQKLKRLSEWVRQSCRPMPCQASLKMKRAEKESLDDILGDAFVDTIFIAKDGSGVLLTDDERLRSISMNEHGTQGTWIQPLLMDLLQRGHITDEQYHDCLIKLISANYRHTSITSGTLLHAAKSSEWAPTASFQQMAELLGSQETDEISVISVTANFSHDICVQLIPELRKGPLLFFLLDAITKGRNRKVVLQKLRIAIEQRFRINPIHRQQALSWADGWERLHPI